MSVRALLAAAIAVVLTAVSPGTADADPSISDVSVETRTVNVWQWNVAGWKLHHGSTTDGLIAAAVSSIRNRDADFVAFNELCHRQYTAIITALRGAGWPTDPSNFARFSAGTDTGCGGDSFGNAIFSRAPLGSADRVVLPSDGKPEQRSLLCAPLRDVAGVRLCTTHITPSNEVIDGKKINETQLATVRARLDHYDSAGDAVIIAGDFNAQPNYGRLNDWYSPSVDGPNNPNNSGRYRELDDADPAHCLGYGENTAADGPGGPCGSGKKIDLIFVPENRIHGGYSGDSLSISQACGGACSDHRIVIGTVTVG